MPEKHDFNSQERSTSTAKTEKKTAKSFAISTIFCTFASPKQYLKTCQNNKTAIAAAATPDGHNP